MEDCWLLRMFRRKFDKSFRPEILKYKVVASVGVGLMSRNIETSKLRRKEYFFCKRAHRVRQWEAETARTLREL